MGFNSAFKGLKDESCSTLSFERYCVKTFVIGCLLFCLPKEVQITFYNRVNIISSKFDVILTVNHR